MARVQKFLWTFPGARKADELIVYPKPLANGHLKFQGDRHIGTVDPETGAGFLARGKEPDNRHLQQAQPCQFSPEFCALVKQHQPKPGDSLGGGVVRLL